jgi:hypothetical protein
MRRSREEILDVYRACQVKLGRAPGKETFCKMSGIKLSEINYYWPRPSALIEEAGFQPGEWQAKLPDDVVFQDFARVCLHIGKIPTSNELRIAQRELGTKTYTAYKRFGNNSEFHARFSQWLQTSSPELKPILQFAGWNIPASPGATPTATAIFPGLRPFLPASLQYLETLARGERPPFESSDLAAATLFERRSADAFRCLGLEIATLGQGTGRKPDALALASRERFAIIIDAKVRSNGYVLGTEDRKFLEYARFQGAELKRQGFDSLYFVVVAPSFKESDLKKLTQYLSDSPIRSVDLITASALMRLVEESIRERSRFSLSEFGQQLFGNKIIAA